MRKCQGEESEDDGGDADDRCCTPALLLLACVVERGLREGESGAWSREGRRRRTSYEGLDDRGV